LFEALPELGALKLFFGSRGHVMQRNVKRGTDKKDSISVASLAPAQHAGWITKRGGKVHSWKRRWLVLKDSMLYYFTKPTVRFPLGILPPGHQIDRPYSFDRQQLGQRGHYCQQKAHVPGNWISRPGVLDVL
jgi:hypothetical protein